MVATQMSLGNSSLNQRFVDSSLDRHTCYSTGKKIADLNKFSTAEINICIPREFWKYLKRKNLSKSMCSYKSNRW